MIERHDLAGRAGEEALGDTAQRQQRRSSQDHSRANCGIVSASSSSTAVINRRSIGSSPTRSASATRKR